MDKDSVLSELLNLRLQIAQLKLHERELYQMFDLAVPKNLPIRVEQDFKVHEPVVKLKRPYVRSGKFSVEAKKKRNRKGKLSWYSRKKIGNRGKQVWANYTAEQRQERINKALKGRGINVA